MLDRLLKLKMKQMLSYLLLIAVVLLLFVIGYLGGSAINEGFTREQPDRVKANTESAGPSGGALVDPPYQVQDFTLTSHTGDPISLSDLQGKPVLMFFGYTHCPDVCPNTLANYAYVQRLLGDQADDVQFVFITVDGERDTPEVVAEYLSRFNADFLGMVGSETELQAVGAEYGLITQKTTLDQASAADNTHTESEEHAHDEGVDVDNYFVEHTSPSFLIDSEGYLRMVYFYGTDPEAIARDLKQIIR